MTTNFANRFRGVALLACALSLSGCLTESDTRTTTNQATLNTSGSYARFDPANSVIPFPNNLLFSGSADGTLNIPVADPTDASDPQVALNALDGFSTIAPMSCAFSTAVDGATIVSGSTVRVFEVTLSGIGGAVTGVVGELTPGVDYVAVLSSVDIGGYSMVVQPLKPLKPKTSYFVAVTNGIQDTLGNNIAAELPYAMAKSTSTLHTAGVSNYTALTDAQAQALEPVRQLVNAAESAVETYTITNDGGGTITDLPRNSIVLSWTMTTQSISDVLTTVQAATTAQTAVAVDTTLTTADALGSGPGAADIYAGTLDVPYYLTNATVATDPLNKPWSGAGGSLLTQYNPSPVATSTETIPLLMTLPNATSGKTMPGGGWPVVIFQHGITQDRTNLLAIADALAYAGFAAVAIDLPLHGITDTSNGLYQAGKERTFNLDLVNNTTSLPAPDGTIDASGTHFINLTNLLLSRDNIRQAVADLMTLHASLATLQDGGGATPLDGSQVYFLGHSLGGMVGTVFLGVDTAVGDAVLAMPGGGIAKLLDGSATFGPVISYGLATNGVVKGTDTYEQFLGAAQTVADSADPLNYASAAATGRGVLLIEVVGGNSSLADQVIPNNVYADAPVGTVPSPLAGTDPLATLMGLSVYNADQGPGASDLLAWVRFNAGHHGSILDPNDASGSADTLSASVWTEMQAETATFLGSAGLFLDVADATLLEAP